MTAQRFRATVELGGRTATGIPVPDDVIAALGGGRRVALAVTVAGHTYRTTTGSMGGRVMLPLSAENRAAAGVSAGDQVDVEVTVDDAPRELEVPADLSAALDAAPAARAFFDSISYSRRRRVVLAVEGAKTDVTRQRRIASSVDKLAAGRDT